MNRPGTQVTYHNAFVISHPVTDGTVAEIVRAGQTEWKVENEDNNTLKTQGYNLEHNVGHGKQHLSALLTTLHILSLLFHAVLELLDHKCSPLRSHLPTHKSVFDDWRV